MLEERLPTSPTSRSRAAQLLYEEEILRNPFSLKHWLRYLTDRKDMAQVRPQDPLPPRPSPGGPRPAGLPTPPPKAPVSAPQAKRYVLYERALRALPGSYKLWKAYLDERRASLKPLCPTHPLYDAMNNTYERALVSMHKMPRIWLDYLAFLTEQRRVTRTRRAFDRALAALPVTQHDRVWPLYLDFVTLDGVPEETAHRVYRRYLKLNPEHAEEYLSLLKARGRWGDAALRLAEMVNDDAFRSLEGKSKHQMWLELCDLVTKHPGDIRGLKVEAIIRGGIRRYRDEVGRLWTSLADYFIQKGLFEKARDVYEEGLHSVMTVRDFSLVYDALVQFEESLVTARMEQAGDDGEGDGEGGARAFVLRDAGDDLDLRLARLEHLIERHPELLSSVVLRQNPHNVHEWHKRVKLFPNNPGRQIQTYTEAVRTVSVEEATGKPHSLWCAFAKFYERHGDLPNARVIFEKATQQEFKFVDDQAQVWCEWVEMELRHNNFTGALEVLRRATEEPEGYREHERLRSANPGHPQAPVQMRVHRNLRLWNLLVDLEETLGTLDSTKAVYYRMLDQRIATPQTVLNFALLLQEHKYFEEAFRVYERGTQTFRFPYSKDIWTTYLQQFVARYGGEKVERARDLFEQVLEQAPREEAKAYYLAYADLEENHGLGRRALAVLDRAVRAVPREEKKGVLDLYISKAASMVGISRVREVFEMAIETTGDEGLADEDCRDICMRYAALEQKLGEVDRARAIWIHGASLANPAKDGGFWAAWNRFEVDHGNEETFREMLRIKRSVAASFSTVHFNSGNLEQMAQQLLEQAARGGDGGDAGAGPADPMAALEGEVVAQGTHVAGFRSAGLVNPDRAGEKVGQGGLTMDGAGGIVNREEIDLDDDDGGVAEKSVPDAVLGSLAKRQRTE